MGADVHRDCAGRSESSSVPVPPTLKAASQIILWPLLLSRLWFALWVYAGHFRHPYLEQIPGGYAGVAHPWLNAWTAYDSQHFLSIALHGYDAHTAAFFPLYPWLLSLAGDNTIVVALWGVLLSNLAFAGALVYLYRLTALEYDNATAKVSVWLLAFFPTAMYFSAVYSESLFLFWFVLTFWCLRRNKWLLTGLCAFLAALTRQVGVLIFAALLIEWWQARRTGSSLRLSALGAAFTPLLALVVWQFVVHWQVGDASRGLSSQEEYLRTAMAPWIPVWRDITLVFSGEIMPVLWLHLGTTVLALVLTVTSWKKQPLSYSIMALGVMLMNFTLARIVPPYTLPIARYLMTMFPFVQRLAIASEPLGRWRVNRVMFIILYLTPGAVFAFRFGMKDFVG